MNNLMERILGTNGSIERCLGAIHAVLNRIEAALVRLPTSSTSSAPEALVMPNQPRKYMQASVTTPTVFQVQDQLNSKVPITSGFYLNIGNDPFTVRVDTGNAHTVLPDGTMYPLDWPARELLVEPDPGSTAVIQISVR